MEIRMRSSVSRTAKGYSVEATLDIGETVSLEIDEGTPLPVSPHARLHNAIDDLSAFQIAKLKEHMAKLGDVFPREE